MTTSKEFLKTLKLTDAEKARMTPEQIAEIEAAFERIRSTEPVKVRNPDRFDAKGMVPVDFPSGKVIPWTIVDDDAEGGDDNSK